MKILTRVAFYVLVLSIFPLSYSYAEDSDPAEEEEVLTLSEAKALIDARDTAKDAIGGTVSGSIEGYYDIYSRQLSFREKSKVYRASLETRRVEFEKPRTAIIETYKDIQNKVFAAESAAYQAFLKENSQKEDDASKEDRQVVSVDKEMMSPDIVDSDDIDTKAVDKPLKEIDVPEDVASSNDGGAVQKKVITSDDAPDFDPANL